MNIGIAPLRQAADTLLSARNLKVHFSVRHSNNKATLRAVDGVNLDIREGEMLGLVGESGCGKSTLGKTLVGLVRATAGSIVFKGTDVAGQSAGAWRRLRRSLQYVYQDAGASLDPRWIVGRSLEEPLVIHANLPPAERKRQVQETLRAVGLRDEHALLYPHELSGGQQRRIGLARVLTLRPRLVVLDEPTSGLDVSVQATILMQLRELRTTYNLAMLFISHDLSVVRMMCDRVAVMYLGRIVEEAPTEELFKRPSHPYTRALLAAVPRPGERHVVDAPSLDGEPPDPSASYDGCRFRSRCPVAGSDCQAEPDLLEVTAHHRVACHRRPVHA